MDENLLKKYYEIIEDYREFYDPFSKSQVVEYRKKLLKNIFGKYSEYLGKKVLDLCCGLGLEAFVLAEMKKEVVGIDIVKDFIKKAESYKKKQKIHNIRFICGDVRKIELGEKFDSVILVGNSIWEFSHKDFVKVIENVKKHLKNNGYFWLVYFDGLERILNEKIQRTFLRGDVIEIPVGQNYGYNPEEGTIEKFMYNINKKEGLRKRFGIWSPSIVEAMLNLAGFKLEIRERLENNEYLEIYRKIS